MDIVPTEHLAAQRNLILYIDIYRIEQVIRNLITNAVRILICNFPELVFIGFSLYCR